MNNRRFAWRAEASAGTNSGRQASTRVFRVVLLSFRTVVDRERQCRRSRSSSFGSARPLGGAVAAAGTGCEPLCRRNQPRAVAPPWPGRSRPHCDIGVLRTGFGDPERGPWAVTGSHGNRTTLPEPGADHTTRGSRRPAPVRTARRVIGSWVVRHRHACPMADPAVSKRSRARRPPNTGTHDAISRRSPSPVGQSRRARPDVRPAAGSLAEQHITAEGYDHRLL